MPVQNGVIMDGPKVKWPFSPPKNPHTTALPKIPILQTHVVVQESTVDTWPTQISDLE